MLKVIQCFGKHWNWIRHIHPEEENCNVCRNAGELSTFGAALPRKTKMYILLISHGRPQFDSILSTSSQSSQYIALLSPTWILFLCVCMRNYEKHTKVSMQGHASTCCSQRFLIHEPVNRNGFSENQYPICLTLHNTNNRLAYGSNYEPRLFTV